MPIDQKKLAVIHITKKELGLSDDEYHRILQEAAGVSTAKDLDEQSFRRLMNFFVRSKYYRLNKEGLTIKQKLYIDYLARVLGWSQDHVNHFINKYYHVDRLELLTKKNASKVIESLKSVQQHHS
jgi:hypothetical protein